MSDTDTELISQTTYRAGSVVPEYIYKVTSNDPEANRLFAEGIVFGVDVLVERHKSVVKVYPLECLKDNECVIKCTTHGENLRIIGPPIELSVRPKGYGG